MDATLPRERFLALCRRLKVAGAAEAYGHLAALLAEPHRAYHNARHVLACLEWCDRVRGFLAAPDEAEFALWLHDAVYDPRAKDNEERSAAWAQELLGGPAGERVAELIRATLHRPEPLMGDAAWIVDIDLAILGAEADDFAAYDAAIRLEYDWVPAEDYRVGRSAVLRGFLERPAIYRTDWFRTRLEDAARRNLAAALAVLVSSPGC